MTPSVGISPSSIVRRCALPREAATSLAPHTPSFERATIDSTTMLSMTHSNALSAKVTVATRANKKRSVVTNAATERQTSPLQRGGTLEGEKAFGKAAGAAAMTGAIFSGEKTKWKDPRWVNGNWDLNQFKNAAGETDWDAVIDAEIVHRKMLEDMPAVYDEDGLFDTSIVPWTVWVRRFHLPEAEKANGRAAMIGYAFAYLIDAAGGAGLVDLHNSFLGKTAILATILFVTLFRSLKDIDTFKELTDEATFYDKQWNASWEGVERPSETQKK